jgi:transposase
MFKDANPGSFAGIYIVCGYTDLRLGIDSLVAIINKRYHMDLFVPNTLFLFCGRSASKIKGILWEGDGFLMLYKRVDCGRFVWPRTSNDLKALSPEQFRWLMQGFAVEPIIHDINPVLSA